MKNSKLKRFFVEMLPILLLLLMIPLIVLSQEASPTIFGGFFGKVGDWFEAKGINALVLMTGAILGSGFTLAIKKYAKLGKVIFHSIETVSGKLEDVCDKVDNAIKDDGSIKANSIQEVIDSGKGVKTEVGNIVVTFTPKT